MPVAADLRERLPAAAARSALLAGPTVLAFFSGGYFEGPRLVAAICAWSALAVLALAVERPLPPAFAGWALGGLAVLAAWTAASREWAPLAGPAGDAAQRDVLYLGTLAAGALAWRSGRWAARVEPALALGALVVIGYGLAGRVLPGVVHLDRSLSAAGRLEQPLTYWNAMGALGAIGFVLCARLAGDRDRGRTLRALAAGAGPPLALGLYLAFSRGALAAFGCGMLALALLAPTWAQLRASALCVEAGAVVVLAADGLDGVASLHGSLGHREWQGAVMLVVLAVAMLATAAVQAHACRAEDEGRLRLGPLALPRGGRLALAVMTIGVAAIPYALAIASERGHGSDRTAVGATAARFGSVGSNRYVYWRVAAGEFADHPFRGGGAGSFRAAWLRERPFPETVRDAHSLYLQTLAELGVVGFLALLVLLAGVAAAARRAWRTAPAVTAGPAAALVVWLVHAGIDWDWELPALTLVAFTLAGLVLARAAPPAGAARPGA